MGEASKPLLPSAPRKPPGAGHALLFAARKVPRRTWLLLALVAGLFGGGVVALLMFTEFDWAGLLRSIAGLPPGLLLLAMALLPIVGFPILPVYLVAGVRFGPLGGGFAVTVATVIHLVGANLIARSILRRPLERLLKRWHAHLPDIPRDEEAAVSFIAALVPGIPYVVRNYLFPIMGLRLRVYLWIVLPVYVARSYVSILLGDLGADPDRTRLFILLGVELLKVVICALVIWWLREHHRRLHGDPAHA